MKNRKTTVRRKESREQLKKFQLACELLRVLKRFFPALLPTLKAVTDKRHPSYIKYQNHVLLMTRILSAIFYISSMRKTSEELNSDTMIENIWELCGEKPTAEDLPYWETINRYLEKLDPDGLQETVNRLCCRLLRSRAFENARIRGKYWQIIIDGTQLYSTTKELDGKCMYRVHKRGTPDEYRENYYYVLEAKLVLHPDIIVSIMTEFVENEEEQETGKQDCERKACWRLMEKLKKAFPRLRICISADSLYACERFFRECQSRKWSYILRYKEGSIPGIAEEYGKLRGMEKNRREQKLKDGVCWYDHVSGIDYRGYAVSLVEYGEERDRSYRKGKKKGRIEEVRKTFRFLTDLPLGKRNITEVVERGRMRWKIENEGFNTQKRQGYHLEHLYSKNYQGLKNHYYLIQIGHMIAQMLEAWERLWRGIRQSREQKHHRILESLKKVRLKEYREETGKRIQIRFI